MRHYCPVAREGRTGRFHRQAPRKEELLRRVRHSVVLSVPAGQQTCKPFSRGPRANCTIRSIGKRGGRCMASTVAWLQREQMALGCVVLDRGFPAVVTAAMRSSARSSRRTSQGWGLARGRRRLVLARVPRRPRHGPYPSRSLAARNDIARWRGGSRGGRTLDTRKRGRGARCPAAGSGAHLVRENRALP